MSLSESGVAKIAGALPLSVDFKVNGTVIGHIPHAASLVLISRFGQVFVKNEADSSISFATAVDGNERTLQIATVLDTLRFSDKETLPGYFKCLQGWRSERYAVWGQNGEKLFAIERSACGLLGVRQYGCHLNGYFRKDNDEIVMWIARRSRTKQTHPLMLDNIVGGKTF